MDVILAAVAIVAAATLGTAAACGGDDASGGSGTASDPVTLRGLTPDPRFFPHGDEFRGLRVHQTRLQGGDASSDSYCFP